MSAQGKHKPQCNASQIMSTLETIFKDAFSKEIFKQAQAGMNRNYKETTDGTKRNLTIIPPVYQYNSKIATHEVMDSKALEDIVNDLANNVTSGGSSISSPTYKPGDVEKIKKLLQDLKPQTSEGNVFTELSLFLCNHRGLMIHGFEPGQGLKVFVDEAENQRKQKLKTTNNVHNFDLLEIEEGVFE